MAIKVFPFSTYVAFVKAYAYSCRTGQAVFINTLQKVYALSADGFIMRLKVSLT